MSFLDAARQAGKREALEKVAGAMTVDQLASVLKSGVIEDELSNTVNNSGESRRARNQPNTWGPKSTPDSNTSRGDAHSTPEYTGI